MNEAILKNIVIIKRDLQVIKEEFITIFDQKKFDIQLKELEELEKMTTIDGFWDNHIVATDTTKIINQKKKHINALLKIKNDIEKLESILADENAYLLIDEIKKDFVQLQNDFESIKIFKYFDFKYDKNNAILEIHTGMGGDDANDFSNMLLRMYINYAQKKGFDIEILDMVEGDTTGIKKAYVKIVGDYAYGIFKHEKGVHRLIRLSPFKSNNSRQTSFSMVEVLPILQHHNTINIKDSDIKIDFCRSSGAGGQNVNKVETAVRITHIPTNIVVSCKTQRSQSQNRQLAMEMLYSKILKQQIESEENELRKLKGQFKSIDMGSQIRTYTLHPYKLVKDHRSNFETSDIEDILNGNLDTIINSLIIK